MSVKIRYIEHTTIAVFTHDDIKHHVSGQKKHPLEECHVGVHTKSEQHIITILLLLWRSICYRSWSNGSGNGSPVRVNQTNECLLVLEIISQLLQRTMLHLRNDLHYLWMALLDLGHDLAQLAGVLSDDRPETQYLNTVLISNFTWFPWSACF